MKKTNLIELRRKNSAHEELTKTEIERVLDLAIAAKRAEDEIRNEEPIWSLPVGVQLLVDVLAHFTLYSQEDDF